MHGPTVKLDLGNFGVHLRQHQECIMRLQRPITSASHLLLAPQLFVPSCWRLFLRPLASHVDIKIKMKAPQLVALLLGVAWPLKRDAPLRQAWMDTQYGHLRIPSLPPCFSPPKCSPHRHKPVGHLNLAIP